MRKGDLKELEIYEYIKSYSRDKGYSPSYREIAVAVNIKSTNSIKKYIDRLIEKNLLARQDNKARCLNYQQNNGSNKNEVLTIPVLGKVAAGNPILAFENIEDEIVISKHFFNTSQELFMLKVSGDSMINIGIDDGDHVVVKKQNNAENGDIVVAYIDGYATVKNFYKYGDSIRLQPQNELYKPIITKDCVVLGKVVGCIKKF